MTSSTGPQPPRRTAPRPVPPQPPQSSQPGSGHISQPAPTAAGDTRRSRPNRPALRPLDLIVEATAALTARPGRTLLTALGTVLGVAALVATLGLSRTAGNQIITRFDELGATSVVIKPANDSFGSRGGESTSAIPWDAGDRLARLNGVVAAGTLSAVGTWPIRSVPVIDPLGTNDVQLPVYAGSGGLFGAVRAQLATGRFFDEGHSSRHDPVVVLGPGAAQRLNVTRVDQQPVIFMNDKPLIVLGILADVERQPDLLNAIIVTDGTAEDQLELGAPAETHVDVEIGAAELIGEQAPFALSPNNPDLLRSVVPASPKGVQEKVAGDVNSLFIVLGAISLLVGAVGIANITLVAVLERVGEIGLRRALGAARRHIAIQFLLESGTVGFLGGVMGASLGVLVIVAVSASRQWTPVLEPWLPLIAPPAGGLIGILAGVYPALKAARMEPVTALRQAI